MKKAILTFAAESAMSREWWDAFRVQAAASGVALVSPTEVTANAAEWLEEHSKVDFLFVLFTAPTAPPPAVEEAVAAEAGAAPGAAGGIPPDPAWTDRLVLTRLEREQRPAGAELVVVVATEADRAALPADLGPARCYVLADEYAADALRFRVLHRPADRWKRIWAVAGPGVWKIAVGVGALLVGMRPKVSDLLVAYLGERLAVAVHCAVTAGVLFLLCIGLFQLVRCVMTRFCEHAHRRAGGWRGLETVVALIVATSISTYLFFVHFPRRPSVDSLVAANAKMWALRIEESKYHDGGIRVHRDQGVAQVWISSQSICGLLAGQADWPTQVGNVQKVFTFIDRTEITPLKLRAGKQAELQKLLPEKFRQTNLESLPTQFANFAMAIDALEFAARGEPLPMSTIEAIEKKKADFFAGMGQPSGEGWGYFEQWEWGVTEIAAWVALAEIGTLRADAPAIWNDKEKERVRQQIRDVVKIIHQRQIPGNGAFSPIADTSQLSFARTYSTIMALWAMAEAMSPDLKIYNEEECEELGKSIQQAAEWLQLNVSKDGKGWKEYPENPAEVPMLGLTAQTLFIVRRIPASVAIERETRQVFANIERQILQTSSEWLDRPVAKNDVIHDADRYLPPTVRVIEGSTILWYPWTVALLRSLAAEKGAPAVQQKQAASFYKRLAARSPEFTQWVEAEPNSQYNYVPAEALIGFRWPVGR